MAVNTAKMKTMKNTENALENQSGLKYISSGAKLRLISVNSKAMTKIY